MTIDISYRAVLLTCSYCKTLNAEHLAIPIIRSELDKIQNVNDSNLQLKIFVNKFRHVRIYTLVCIEAVIYEQAPAKLIN